MANSVIRNASAITISSLVHAVHPGKPMKQWWWTLRLTGPGSSLPSRASLFVNPDPKSEKKHVRVESGQSSIR